MTRRERLERKLEKRAEWADNARERGQARFDAANKICEHIPFGQPILVGHHSERHARADQKRIHNHMDKGCEEMNKADYHEQKAQGLEMQLKRTIFSDDADAIEQLEAKIRNAEEMQERMKAANKIVRKYKGNVEAGVAELIKAGFSEKIAVHAFTPDFCGRVGFPSYALTNNSSEIRRCKERIEQIKIRAARQEKAEATEGGVLIEGEEYVRVTFPEFPGRDVINALKAADFRWSGGSWHGRRDRLPESVQP